MQLPLKHGKANIKKMSLVPFVILGILAFTGTSSLNLSYFWRGYVVLLETQAGLVILYFLMHKLSKIYAAKP
ncbi:hypothetical protein [Laspinema olomoucense]|uniref:Uncharacterized protein n=1 Tax=Laspinema olomoucense D3b TaxID=2953688 RepID=A0ABT2NCG3_9CYAN|nr:MULTISPECIES: hypothetical protein [unclassified Laspinema]MCT7979559.1 hypothetical protein [Laspinema sp. D3b]